MTLDNSSKNSFSVDENNFYGTTTVYNIKIKDGNLSPYYVVGILNSKLLDFYHKSKSVPQANGFYRYQAIFIKDLPIPIADTPIQRKVERLVQILVSETHQEIRDSLCQQIDLISYHLYNLSYDEILIVDPNTLISKKEYEDAKYEKS